MEDCIQCAERAGWSNFKTILHDLWKATEIKDLQWLEAKNPTHSYSFRKRQITTWRRSLCPFLKCKDFLYFSLCTLLFVLSLGTTREESGSVVFIGPFSCLYTLTFLLIYPQTFLPQPKQSQLSSSPDCFTLQSYYSLASYWIPSSTSTSSHPGSSNTVRTLDQWKQPFSLASCDWSQHFEHRVQPALLLTIWFTQS